MYVHVSLLNTPPVSNYNLFNFYLKNLRKHGQIYHSSKIQQKKWYLHEFLNKMTWLNLESKKLIKLLFEMERVQVYISAAGITDKVGETKSRTDRSNCQFSSWGWGTTGIRPRNDGDGARAGGGIFVP